MNTTWHVWVVYNSDFSMVAVFSNELHALRYALTKAGSLVKRMENGETLT